MSHDGIRLSATRSEAPPRRRRVLILGGGFGGAYAAQRLGETLGKREDVDVVLISRENYLLFTPMLHEVAAGDLYPPDIVEPLRKWLRRIPGLVSLTADRPPGEVADALLEMARARQRLPAGRAG